MTDRALTGKGDPDRSVMEPARIPGHGSIPAPVARWWLRRAEEGSVWLRRLYTAPGGRDLVAMDSRRRLFTGMLRRMLVLRDDLCTTPWCGAAIAHADHATPARDGGPTDFVEGNGKCVRCNHTKEAPGWRTEVTGRNTARHLEVTTPSGRRYRSQSVLPRPSPHAFADIPHDPVARQEPRTSTAFAHLECGCVDR